MAREPRKLAAILAADVVGYSHLMGPDESGTLLEFGRREEHPMKTADIEYRDGALTCRGAWRGPWDLRRFVGARPAGFPLPRARRPATASCLTANACLPTARFSGRNVKQAVFVGFSHVLGNVLGIYRPFSAPSCSLRAFKPRFDYWDDL